MADVTRTGRIRRVAGPLIEVEHAATAAMNDLVILGDGALPGEIVAITDNLLRIQAYEYTGGLGPGDVAIPQARPLSAALGPWLLGGVFDGLLRPLDSAGTWLTPGGFRPATGREWRFQPRAASGDTVAPGAVLGIVDVPGPLVYAVQVPVDVAGTVDALAADGDYPADVPIATVAGTPVSLGTRWPVRQPRPFASRRGETEPLHTGQRVLDLLFPIARGGTAAVPGGFGTGKTVLLQQLAKWCDADVIVYVGCGERGNEMAEIVAELFALTDPRTGGTLADRTVVIANTSNMPMMAREVSIYTGITVAEFFRDMGYAVVVIADSTSRWAEALREFSSRTGELPAEEGYPANLASALAAFYERSGAVETLGGQRGSVTVIGAVSPQGGDMTEPVTAHTERFVRCRWLLDRDLAYARHYPAVSWSASFAKDAERFGTWREANGNPGWSALRSRIIGLLAESDRLVALTELIGAAALPGHERMVLLGGTLLREAVLRQNALSDNDAFCTAAKTAALADAVLAVIGRCQDVVASGVPATVIEELDFGPLLRMAEDSGPDDTALARHRGEQLLAAIEELR